MRSQDERWPAAAMAVGLVALAALLGCGGEPSVAGKSAAAFREAEKKGETFASGEHGHEHGAMTPGGEHEMPDQKGMAGMDHAGMAGGEHDMPGMDHSGMPHGGKQGKQGMAGMDHAGTAHGSMQGMADMAGMDHAGTAHGGKQGMVGMDHSGMTQGGQGGQGGMPGMDHSRMTQGGMESMAGMDHSAGAAPAPVAVPSAQPARTLSPDALDAPAATSVLEAQRSAEMAQEMSGGGHSGHGGHGGAYRQIDAGREPGAPRVERRQE